MKIVTKLLAVAALLGLTWWLWAMFHPSPEKAIRHRLAQVAKTASFSAGEGMLRSAANVQSLAANFSPDIEITFDSGGQGQATLTGRAEIVNAALAARGHLESLRVELLDVNVALAADGQSADADLTAKATAPRAQDMFVQEMKFTLKKQDGEWLVSRVETVKSLR